MRNENQQTEFRTVTEAVASNRIVECGGAELHDTLARLRAEGWLCQAFDADGGR